MIDVKADPERPALTSQALDGGLAAWRSLRATTALRRIRRSCAISWR